jgi:hypothetical protein
MLDKVLKKVQIISVKTASAYNAARQNFWRFLIVDAIGISGLCFILGTFSLGLAAGSAAAGSYNYHWVGIALMAAAVLSARLEL